MRNNDSYITSIIIMLSIAVYTCLLIFSNNAYGSVLDERIYLRAGLEYLKNPGTIIEYNWEHPPLAKLLYGILYFYLDGNFRLSTYLLGVLNILLFYTILREAIQDKSARYIGLFLLSIDPLFAHISKFGLLDNFMLLFAFLFILTIFKAHKIQKGSKTILLSILMGAFSGLSLACKWSFIYIFIPSILLLMVRFKGATQALTIIASSIGFYFLIYVPALINGVSPITILSLQWNMLSYHFTQHSIFAFISVSSLLKFFFKISLWEVYSGTLYVYSNSTAIIGEDVTYEGWHLYFYYGLGGLSWWLFLPSLIYSVYRLLKPKYKCDTSSFSEEYFVFTGIFQVLFLLHGDIEWYYFDVLPIFYIILTLTIRNINKKYYGFLLVSSLIYALIILYTGRYYVKFAL